MEHENQFDNTDDAILLFSEQDTDFDLSEQTIYFTNNDSAK